MDESVKIKVEIDSKENILTSEYIMSDEMNFSQNEENNEYLSTDPVTIKTEVEEPYENSEENNSSLHNESPVPKRSESSMSEISDSPMSEISDSPENEISESPENERSESPTNKGTESPANKMKESPVNGRSETPVDEKSESPVDEKSKSLENNRRNSEPEKCSHEDIKEDATDGYLDGSFRYYKPDEAEHMKKNTNDLRVFQVLDECVASDDDTGECSDSDISYEEIEAMLEEGLKNKTSNEKFRPEGPATNGTHGIQFTEHNALILEELGHNHFDMLPEGWIQVTHKSGMPIYLHKGSRVCTFSRPYYLGQGSVRKHNVPLNAIPCLQYRRALEEEEKRKEAEEERNPVVDGHQYLHTAKIETTEENKLSQSLNALAIQQYCQKLFRFKKEQRLHFDSWADRRKYAKSKKTDKDQRPSFPDGTKLIKFPIQNPEDGPKGRPRGEWIMNPNGKSYICILHEYVQHALKKQPTYEFKALENPSTPYSATVIINDMRYGYGTGTSKKQAKLAAAKASLEILIPEMREKIRSDNRHGKRSGITNFPDEEESSLTIFDEIKIEDPRVAEFCAKTTEPSPYSILLTCLQRNFGLKEMPIDYKVNPLHRQSNEFIMTVGKHTARVICKNKKEGKQRASQAILQDLHPHITSWGALLRLYGNRSVRNVKEKKQEEQEITMLQSKASLNSPNYSIINKLRSEMNKLHEQQMKVRPIGIFIPPAEINLPSSGTELDKVDF